MKKTDNYKISRDRAQAYFLSFDQKQIIRMWKLSHDDAALYVRFLRKEYSISRATGEVFRSEDGTQADFSEVLSIFDFLCHEGTEKFPSGRLAPVNSLAGSPKAGGVGVDFHVRAASFFDENPEAFQEACRQLGGIPVDMGDIGFQFPLFGELNVVLKFYHSDEDFPAGITLLWDQNLLQYIHYETVFYIAGFLMESIQNLCKNKKQIHPQGVDLLFVYGLQKRCFRQFCV